MGRQKFLLVGCGRIGRRHAQILAQRGEILGVVDSNRERADEFAESWSAMPWHSLETCLNELKEPCDLAVICTPNGLHARHASMCLSRGLNVVVEKPLALTFADSWKLLHLADLNNRRIFAMKQNRHNSAVKAVKNALDSGVLGRPYTAHLSCLWQRPESYFSDDWHGTLDLDGGVLFTQFSHFVDLLLWFFGPLAEARGFSSTTAHSNIEFEDQGVVSLRFASGLLASMHFSINCAPSNLEGGITIVGERGAVGIGGEYLNKISIWTVPEPSPILDPEDGTANDYGNYQGSMSNHPKAYDTILAALSGEGRLTVSAMEAAIAVQAIETIYSAIR